MEEGRERYISPSLNQAGDGEDLKPPCASPTSAGSPRDPPGKGEGAGGDARVACVFVCE